MLRGILEEKWTRAFGEEQTSSQQPETSPGTVLLGMATQTAGHGPKCSHGRAFEVLVPKTTGGLMINFQVIVRRGDNRIRRLLVQSLQAGSLAEQQGILRAGDEIREINGLSVTGKFHEDVLRDISRDRDDHVLVTVFRRGLGEEESRAMDKQGVSFVVKTRELVSQHSWNYLLHDV